VFIVHDDKHVFATVDPFSLLNNLQDKNFFFRRCQLCRSILWHTKYAFSLFELCLK